MDENDQFHRDLLLGHSFGVPHVRVYITAHQRVRLEPLTRTFPNFRIVPGSRNTGPPYEVALVYDVRFHSQEEFLQVSQQICDSLEKCMTVKAGITIHYDASDGDYRTGHYEKRVIR